MKKILGILLTLSITSSFADYIIKAGSHTLQENEQHQKICKQYNAQDVTDLSDITLIGNTTDAVICFSSNVQPPIVGSLTSNSLMVSSLTTSAPSATLNFAPYWIRGLAYYSNGRVGDGLAMHVGVPADNCGVIGGSNIPVTSGSAYVQVTCSYPTSTGPRQSFMQASIEGANSTSYGTITLN